MCFLKKRFICRLFAYINISKLQPHYKTAMSADLLTHLPVSIVADHQQAGILLLLLKLRYTLHLFRILISSTCCSVGSSVKI